MQFRKPIHLFIMFMLQFYFKRILNPILLNVFSFVLIVATCFSCRSDGYTEITPELYYQLFSIGENNRKVQSGDYITVDFNYKTSEDSVFFKGKRKFRAVDQGGAGSIIPAILRMSEGDSARIKINANEFFNNTLDADVPDFLNSGIYMFIDLKINEIQSKSEFEIEKILFMQWLNEFNSSEIQQISDYMERENVKLSPTGTGLYFITLREGNDNKVKIGKRVWIHYTGRFLNGRFVDNSNSLSKPVDYVFGTEMFLIEGLEEALGRMYEHEKALVIIPSNLAFGSFGTADNIVPPYTTLIYEIEVVKVE